ncbi:MAG: caspase family protein [Acidobacteriota bacterium]
MSTVYPRTVSLLTLAPLRPDACIPAAHPWRVVLGFLLLILSVNPQPAAAGDDRALLIGVSRYEGWTPLANPITDVRALERVLRDHLGYRTTVLENPSRLQVEAEIRALAQRRYQPDDRLIIVFAGHGVYDPVSDIGYIITADSFASFVDPYFMSMISYPLLLNKIDAIDAPNILVVVDACFAGSIHSARPPHRAPANRSGPIVRQFLTSTGIDHAPDGAPNPASPFAARFSAGLRAIPHGRSTTIDALMNEFLAPLTPTPQLGPFGAHSGHASFSFTPPQARRTALRNPVAPASDPHYSGETRVLHPTSHHVDHQRPSPRPAQSP